MTRIYVPVSNDEFVALSKMAIQNLRHPRDQARMILRTALLGEPITTEVDPLTASNLAERTVNGFGKAIQPIP